MGLELGDKQSVGFLLEQPSVYEQDPSHLCSIYFLQRVLLLPIFHIVSTAVR